MLTHHSGGAARDDLAVRELGNIRECNRSSPKLHIGIANQRGRPCIAGTRIRVQGIYVWHELPGQTPEEIVTDFKQLTLAGVQAALAYYHDHREAIEAEVRGERAEADQLKLSHPSKLQVGPSSTVRGWNWA